MLKYLYAMEVFREIPDEVSLGISISNCQIHCPGCHSPELWHNKGKSLTWPVLKKMIDDHRGITCLLLLGGEHSIPELTELFFFAHKKLKTAWYCGLDELPKQHYSILQYLDYIKIGSYKKELGGLDCPDTNQRLFFIEHQGDMVHHRHDITYKLQRNGKNA